MPPRKHVAPELIAEGKYLYEETLTPTDEIGARMGLSRSAFYLRVKQWKWQRRRYSAGVREGEALVLSATYNLPRAEPTPALVEITGEPRAALCARVYRAASAQMDTIESIQSTLRQTTQQPAQSERTVRILATLNKALVDIASIATLDEKTTPDEPEDDTSARDIDAFRLELAQRLNALINAKAGDSGGSHQRIPAADEIRGT